MVLASFLALAKTYSGESFHQIAAVAALL